MGSEMCIRDSPFYSLASSVMWLFQHMHEGNWEETARMSLENKAIHVNAGWGMTLSINTLSSQRIYVDIGLTKRTMEEAVYL